MQFLDREIDAICFDMDGVIVDSEPAYLATIQEVCRRRRIDVPNEAWLSYRGLRSPEIFSDILKRVNDKTLIVGTLLEERRAVEDAEADALVSILGAPEFVSNARTFFTHIGLATSSGRSFQEEVCTAFGLSDAFDAIVTGDDVKAHKPDPAPYLLAAERLKVNPENMLVVEDSIYGVTAGVRAGAHVIGLTTSFPSEQLRAAGAHNIVESFSQFEMLLRDGGL